MPPVKVKAALVSFLQCADFSIQMVNNKSPQVQTDMMAAEYYYEYAGRGYAPVYGRNPIALHLGLE